MERFKAAWRALSGAERDALAEVIGAGRRYLDNVALENERRQLSPRFCVGVELAFKGKFTCEELAPDEPWRRVKDRAWPNKAGRPVLDYAELGHGLTEKA
jgi:DNA-binding transcriptional regulator YdaS (Cro superfamily)